MHNEVVRLLISIINYWNIPTTTHLQLLCTTKHWSMNSISLISKVWFGCLTDLSALPWQPGFWNFRFDLVNLVHGAQNRPARIPWVICKRLIVQIFFTNRNRMRGGLVLVNKLCGKNCKLGQISGKCSLHIFASVPVPIEQFKYRYIYPNSYSFLRE